MTADQSGFGRSFPDHAIRELLGHPENLRELVAAVAPDLVGGFDFSRMIQLAVESQMQTTLKSQVQTMAETTWKTSFDEEFEQGQAAGEAVGEARGEARARREVLKQILQKRFDKVPQQVMNQIDAIDDVEKLNSLVDQALDAQSLEELEL